MGMSMSILHVPENEIKMFDYHYIIIMFAYYYSKV
mgnify:CR=1 FL=1